MNGIQFDNLIMHYIKQGFELKYKSVRSAQLVKTKAKAQGWFCLTLAVLGGLLALLGHFMMVQSDRDQVIMLRLTNTGAFRKKMEGGSRLIWDLLGAVFVAGGVLLHLWLLYQIVTFFRWLGELGASDPTTAVKAHQLITYIF